MSIPYGQSPIEFVTTQVDRLKAEGFEGYVMRDHIKHWASELADEVVMVVYRVAPKVVETEKVLNGVIRALRENVEPSAFSLST